MLPESSSHLRELDAEADFYGLNQLRAIIDVGGMDSDMRNQKHLDIVNTYFNDCFLRNQGYMHLKSVYPLCSRHYLSSCIYCKKLWTEIATGDGPHDKAAHIINECLPSLLGIPP